MNDTATADGTAGIDAITLLIVNAIIGFATLIINAHQSYKSSSCESECCGHELMKIDSSKAKFDV